MSKAVKWCLFVDIHVIIGQIKVFRLKIKFEQFGKKIEAHSLLPKELKNVKSRECMALSTLFLLTSTFIVLKSMTNFWIDHVGQCDTKHMLSKFGLSSSRGF